MWGIVLTYDEQAGLAELLHKSYAACWGEMPIHFRIAYNGKKEGSALDYLRSQADCELVQCSKGVSQSMRALLQGIDDREWVYWAIDDRYPLEVVAPRFRAALESLPELSEDIEEVKLLRWKDRKTPQTVEVGKERFFVQSTTDRCFGFWHHHFARAGVLRRVFLDPTIPPKNSIRHIQRRLRETPDEYYYGHAVLPSNPILKLAEPLRRGLLTSNGLRDLRRLGCEVPQYGYVDKAISFEWVEPISDDAA